MRHLTWLLTILVVSGTALNAHAAATFVGTQIPYGQYQQPYDTEVLAPTVPGQPVRLLVSYCASGNGVVSPPVATAWGMEIQVTQSVTDGGATQECALYLIDLGQLPNGTYHVTTTRSFSKAGDSPSTYEFRFIVQEGTPSAPCNGVQSVTTAPDGGAMVRYETQYYGYAPSFGVPSVRFENCCHDFQVVGITQPATDLAGMPHSLLCHAEEVNLGRLPEGAYSIAFGYLPSIPMPSPSMATLNEFQWRNGAAACSNIPSFSTRGSLLSTEPFDVVRTQMGYAALFNSSSVDVGRSSITIDETAFFDDVLPTSGGLPGCASRSVSVGPIPAGTYTVNWTTHERPGVTNETEFFQVTISNPPSVIRRRAARH